MDFIIGLCFVTTFLSAFIYACWRWPVAVIIIVTAIACGVIVGTGNAEASTRFEVAAVIESEADRTTMQDAVRDAAAIYKDQLDVELVVTDVTVSTIAGHTSATFLLDAVKAYRAQHLTADVTVLFTRRTLTQGYQGIATVGPACSAQASAIVAIRNDGEDGAILAHELLHTVGVPHDKASGYLMSETISRSTSRTMSQDSVLTFNAAGVVDCMAVAPPAAAKTSTPAASTGGGGSTDGVVIAILALLIIARLVIKVRETNADKRDIQLALTKARNAMEDLAMYATQRREESEVHLAVRKQTANLLATCTADNARLYSALGEADGEITAANVQKVAAQNEVERLKAVILTERRQHLDTREKQGKRELRLRLALQAAWPYVHNHCTIKTVRTEVAALMNSREVEPAVPLPRKQKPSQLTTVADMNQLMDYYNIQNFDITCKGPLHDIVSVPMGCPFIHSIRLDIEQLHIIGHRLEVEEVDPKYLQTTFPKGM